METTRFLRDIEDETKYAQGLELAYVDVRDEINRIVTGLCVDAARCGYLGCEPRLQSRRREIANLVLTMSMVIRDCADRRKRLADVARGLSDVVFDEERG